MTETARQRGQRRRRARERRARCVRTRSGALIDLRAPDPAAVELADIAHGLAVCRRFAGRGISVAEHSVLVSQLLPAELQLAGLLHDAAEAYTGDIVRPVKVLIPGYARIERRIEAAILEGLHLEVELHDPVVKEADREVLHTEVADQRCGMTARAAEQKFLAEYARLTS